MYPSLLLAVLTLSMSFLLLLLSSSSFLTSHNLLAENQQHPQKQQEQQQPPNIQGSSIYQTKTMVTGKNIKNLVILIPNEAHEDTRQINT